MMSEEEVEALVGLTVEEARRRVEAKGWRLRVLSEDGVGRPSTADLRDDRVNVAVSAGKVTQVGVG